jgi:poly-gamma-glutamate capsule biosynthesis protein CapA/YwtB (metallophosphatase superfamily)
MRLPRHKLSWVIAGFVAVILGLAVVYVLLQSGASIDRRHPAPPRGIDNHSVSERRIRVAAMGDMLAHDTIISGAKTDTGYDFGHYFSHIRTSYADADMVFCNQEGLSSGDTYGISGYPSFNAPIEFAAGLHTGAGCNVINLANNHMGDKGVGATNATLDVWNEFRPLALSGANKDATSQNTVSYGTVKDLKLGFVSFADFNNNTATPAYSINNYHDEALVRRLVGEARRNADIVIVSMHWGEEDSGVVNQDQQQAAALLASLGVDVVLGTGPHVLQKVDTLPRADGGVTTVWYSLGNMLSSQLDIKGLIGGIATFDIVKKQDERIGIEQLSFVPTYMHYEWTVDEKARNDLTARKNAKIYLLKDAAAPLSRSLFSTTVEEQRQYVIHTLGDKVTVK